MAVEIPVVIDIDKAFQDAAKNVPGAMKPLRDSINNLQADISLFRDKLNNATPMSKNFELAAKNVAKLEQALDLLNSKINQFSTNAGSVRRLSGDLAVIQKQFERMGSKQMFNTDGSLSADAKKLQQDYAKVATELDKVRKILTAEYEAQKRVREESERQAQAAREHQAALTMTANSVNDLNTKLAAWRKELNSSAIGSNEFQVAAFKVQELALRLAEAGTQAKFLGSNIRSLNEYNAKLQELNAQYAALSQTDRRGAKGQNMLATYRKVSAEMEKEGKSLQQIIQREKQLDAIIASTTSKRRYENAVLNSTANTMHRLSEQARILQERLERARFGTKNYEELRAKLDEVQSKMQRMQGTVSSTTTLFNKQSTVLRNLTSMASMYVSLFGALRFVKQIRDVTGELEYQRVALGRLIQDEEYGAVLFERIKESAVKSPFRIKDLVTYTKQLAAYRIEEENLFTVTQRLADVSAGLGVDMNRLILAYGQVRAASVLRGQELRQFTEAGIPMVELLAEKMGELNDRTYSTADVFKLISERAVPFSAVADIFEDLTEKGGMFYKMQEEQAKTLKGQWEKLKDTYDIALQDIGESKGLLSFQSYNKVFLEGLNILAKGLRMIPKALEGAALAWTVYSLANIKASRNIRKVARAEIEAKIATEANSRAKLLGVKHTQAYTAALVRQQAATNGLTRSFWKLWAAMVANPIGAVISLLAGLAAAFFSFRKNTDTITTELTEAKEAVEDLAQAEKKYAKTDKLIEQYVSLASKTERTEDETRKLHSTLSKLSDIFPDLTDNINAETESLEANAQALRDRNEAELEASKEDAKEKLKAAKINRENLQKQLEGQLEDRKKAFIEMSEMDSMVNFYHYKSQKQLDKATQKYNEMDAAVNKTKSSIASLDETIVALEDYLSPKDTIKRIEGWKDEVREMNEYKTSLGTQQVFTPKEIDDLDSVYDYFKKLKKVWTEAKTAAEGLEVAYKSCTNALRKADLYNEWQDAQAAFNAADTQRERFGFNFTKKTSGSGYTQDPFIKQIQERLKFMKDYQKGFEDLGKYMSKAAALGKESSIMLSRGLALGLDANEQKMAAENLSKWYKDTYNAVFSKLKKEKGVTGTIEDFLSRQITGKTNRDKMLRDFQSLIQSLWDAKTDYDTSQEKKNWEESLKRLSDEIKQSEAARNFYQDILNLTGDERLATTLGVDIYGDFGQGFKGRIQKQLDEAFATLDSDKITDELRTAFSTQDFGTIMANLDKFPEEWRKRLKEMASDSQKYNADRVKDLLKALEDAKSYGDKQVELTRQTALRAKDIQDLEVRDDVKAQMLRQNSAKAAMEAAKIAYETFKEMPMYVDLFDDLDQASSRMLKNMRQNLEDMRDNWKSLTPRELKELQSRINELDEQIASRNPFKALISSVKEYIKLQKEQSNGEVELAVIAANTRVAIEKEILAEYQKQYDEAYQKKDVDEEAFEIAQQNLDIQATTTDLAIEEAQAAQNIADKYKDSKKHIRDAADKLSEWAGYLTDSVGAVREIFDTFASDDASETFGIIADGIGKTVGGMTEMGQGLAKILTGTDIAGGAVDMIKGLGDLISGTFGTSKALKIKAINKQIEDQDRLLGQLEYSYGRLDKAIEKAFGSDYIYNYSEQLKNLAAQQAAYEEQARLEREKGKKKDKDKIAEYEQSARDTADAIEEMSGQLSEYFSGSELTSAAEDFANSWIEAYQEFGSTTDAMKEKFQDMINNMITKSLAGKIMQQMLRPIFDEIDRLAQDGDLTASEIGRVSDMATAAIPQIDNAMTTLMNNLIASGIDLRTHAGQFTGISRDLAGASEESILGLAAGVNTANFYMSHLPAIAENVAALRVALAGETPETVRTTPSEGPTYEDQMLGYVSTLPQMRDDMYYVRTLLDRVIKPKGQGGYAVVIQ